jgi:hypothetical protein
MEQATRAMKPNSAPRVRAWAAAVTLLVSLALSSGCGSVFFGKLHVLVDALTATDAPKPNGLSYRLLWRRSAMSPPVAQPIIAECVRAALNGRGMFEAPPRVPPDVFVEVGYGRDSAPQIQASDRETFLQLSGRTNPEKSLITPTGHEVWDVRVALRGLRGPVENAMPALASVASDHLGADTRVQSRVDIPRNAPEIELVRQAALKALQAPRTPPAAPGGSAGSGGAGGAAATASGG